MTKADIRKKVVCAGHICLDISPAFPGADKRPIDELFVPGKLLCVEKAQVSPGGSVANTGLALAFFGADVRLMGKTGDDDFGAIISRIVQSRGIAEALIVSAQSGTSYSIVLAPPGHDRMFLHYSGTNDSFCFDDLDFDAIKVASLFHFGYPTQMKLLYSDGGRELTKIFKAVREAGVCTSLDLAAVDPNSEAGKADWRAILAATLPYVDFFVPSFEELLFMLDRDKYESLSHKADRTELTAVADIERDIRPLAQAALDMGASCILLKCGEPGLMLKCGGGMQSCCDRLGLERHAWSNYEHFERSYKAGRIVSATGAGDTAIAAFLMSLLLGFGPEKALQYAAAAGACCVSEYDALSGLVSFDEMTRKINEGWPKLDPNGG